MADGGAAISHLPHGYLPDNIGDGPPGKRGCGSASNTGPDLSSRIPPHLAAVALSSCREAILA